MRHSKFAVRSVCALVVTLALGGCNDDDSSGGGSGDPDPTTDPVAFSVGGMISGNEGNVTLSLNGEQEIFSGGAFTFTKKIEDGNAYGVSFISAGGQSCSIANAAGIIKADVNDVSVTCSGEPTGSGRRVVRAEKDFDANGIPEEVVTVTYADNAHTVTLESVYMDDGTPDLFRRGDETIVYSVQVMRFSDAGLPLSLTTENTHEDGSITSGAFAYSYKDGVLETMPLGTPVYTDGRLSAMTFELGGVSGQWRFSYDVNGFLSETLYTVNDTDIERAEYIWREDGQLEGIEKIQLNADDEVSTLSTVYDAGGRLQSMSVRDGVFPEYKLYNYTEQYTRDGNGNIIKIEIEPLSTETVEASEEWDWEDGACFNFYVPQPAGLRPAFYGAGENALFPAGVFTQVMGCQP